VAAAVAGTDDLVRDDLPVPVVADIAEAALVHLVPD
jgi:hypothetical protein